MQPALDLPRDMYLGLEFTETEMESAIKASGLAYRRMPDPAGEIGAMLADGQDHRPVQRSRGSRAAGPGQPHHPGRPRDLRSIRKLNFAIKQRDFWMPFAASVLDEDADKYMTRLDGWAFYMIEAFDTHPMGPSKTWSPACTRWTSPIRPQVVNELNSEYREIIQAFKRRTGVGAILNTSFNLHGFPIVGTPEVAIDTLVKSDLDGLALGPFLVTKGG